MQSSAAFVPVRPSQANCKPRLISFDSGHECSLDHWLELSWLVEMEDKDELEGYIFDETCLLVSK